VSLIKIRKGDFFVLLEILKDFPKTADSILEILLKLQQEKDNHFISRDEIKTIAEYVGEPESRVYSVVSFYTLLKTKPQGKYIIQICKDVPCYVLDDFNLKKTLSDLLKIDIGEVDANQLFSLEYSSCLGCCELAPMMRINHKIYGHLTKDKVKAILSTYMEDAND
jgi:NADH-quinone oxidoreductase subunit E